MFKYVEMFNVLLNILQEYDIEEYDIGILQIHVNVVNLFLFSYDPRCV